MEIDPRTLDTGVKKLDALLAGEMFFDVGKFKTARFTGHAVRFADGVPTEFDGELTIKGVTQPVHLTADRFVCQEVSILVIKRFVCGGDLTATLKRSDFGLTKYLSMVSDDVRLRSRSRRYGRGSRYARMLHRCCGAFHSPSGRASRPGTKQRPALG